MNIESLEYFKKIAEVKSISKVSQQSHISQSALSQIISKLEDSVGHELLSRSNKGVEITTMGKVVYEYADIILKTVQKMKDELDCMANNQCNVLINSTWAIANYSLPCLLFEISNKHPHFHYELRSNRSEDIIENVLNGIVDFGIIYGDPKMPNIDTIPFGHDQVILVSHTDSEIADTISIDDLLNYHLINFKHGCYYNDVKHTIEKIKHKQYEFNPLLNLDSISAVKSSVSNGLGIAFLPLSSVKKELNENRFKRIQITDLDLELKVSIISLPHDDLSLPVQNIIKLFTKLGPKSLC